MLDRKSLLLELSEEQENAPQRDTKWIVRDRRLGGYQKVSVLCRESLLMASPTEYLRTCQPKGFLSVSEDTYQVRQVGFLPSIEPWNKSRRYRTVTLNLNRAMSDWATCWISKVNWCCLSPSKRLNSLGKIFDTRISPLKRRTKTKSKTRCA